MSNTVPYPRTSPYNETKLVDRKFLDVMTHRPIPKKSDDVLVTISTAYENRPDLMAFDLYGDAKLWWVFAARNPNKLGADPYFNFTAGTEIFVPKLSTLQTALGI